MGVYRSQPIREKDSVDDEGPTMCYGASSMQGWRMTQEDAHNCCLDYDNEKNMSLFAVYDGHGGSEVAEYTAINFPDFIKNMPDFKEGKLSQALEDAFLEFDEKLTKPEIIKQLKELAGVEDEQCEEEREQEVKGLYEEADMPLEELLQRYQPGVKSLRELRKNEIRKNEPSPALKAKKEKALTEGDDDIKENLEEKLVNGEGDCNGDHMVSDKALSTSENTENSSDTEEQGGGEVNAKDGRGDGLDVKGEVTDAQISRPDCPEEGTIKMEAVVCSQSECSEAAASGPTDTNAKSDSSITTQDSKNNAAEALPDSTQKDSTPDKAAKESEQIPKRETNGETEVSSSSEGSVSQVKVDGGGSSISSVSASSSCETSMTVTGEGSVNPSSSGESGRSASAQGSEPSSGSSSTYSAVADSSSKAEPCSSSGRTRSGRKNIIPEEGEDESSFDEDEDTTDDDDSEEDVADFVEEDSEDDSEDDQLEEGEVEEEVEGEEEGGVAYSMEPGSDSGCTAVVALLRGRELYVANAGDSRCVVCREGKAVDMSFDHKPEDMVELKRILNAGGQVTPDGRVNGGLNLSRAIGDHAYKKNTELPLKDQMISSLPDIRCITLDEKDEFMVLACDGIWNSLSSQDTVTFVKDRLKGGTTSLSTICEELFECCLAPNTCGDGSGCDNMTCIIVKFKEELLKLHSTGDSMKRRASSDAESSQTDPKKQKEGD